MRLENIYASGKIADCVWGLVVKEVKKNMRKFLKETSREFEPYEMDTFLEYYELSLSQRSDEFQLLLFIKGNLPEGFILKIELEIKL